MLSEGRLDRLSKEAAIRPADLGEENDWPWRAEFSGNKRPLG